MLRKDVEEMVQLGKLLKKIVDKIFKCFGRILGIEIVFSRAAKKDCDIRGKRLINVGAGDWKCRGWICLDYISGNGQDYNEAFFNKDMDNFFEYITEGLTYDPKKAGYHINYWTFSKVKDMPIDSNFTKIIRSKYAGSISEYMKNKMYFDKTFPEMSLYVEAIK